MACIKLWRNIAAAGMSLFLLAINCYAQDQPQDHSCTVNAAGEFVNPFGKDGNNFNSGWGIQAGGGFAVLSPAEPGRGRSLYITANYIYERLNATSMALSAANVTSANSAHVGFSAVTLDPTVRFPVNLQVGLYLSGGFGWLRRGVGFNGPNPATLTQSSSPTLEKLAANSGVFDLGGGINFGLSHRGGLMSYAEVRVYRGVAINSGTTLLPLSVGIRW
jgi:hypothetical protein